MAKINRAMPIKDLKSLNPPSNAKLAQRKEHQTRILEDPSSILTGAKKLVKLKIKCPFKCEVR